MVCIYIHWKFLTWPNLIVAKLKEEGGKKSDSEFVHYKRVVWHKSFKAILLPITDLSKSGLWLICGDKEDHQLWIWIVILSADYEEQWALFASLILSNRQNSLYFVQFRSFMSLLRGPKSLFPCIVCLVPRAQITKLWKDWERRTGEKAKQVLAHSRAQLTKGAAEEVLKNWSLRGADVSAYFQYQ